MIKNLQTLKLTKFSPVLKKGGSRNENNLENLGSEKREEEKEKYFALLYGLKQPQNFDGTQNKAETKKAPPLIDSGTQT